MGIEVKSTGKSVPALVVTNEDMSRLVETSNEWIVERTGIKTRNIATTETALDLAAAAARQALGWTEGTGLAEDGGGPGKMEAIPAESIDLVIVASVSPDQVVPAMSALVKKELGLSNAVGFDLNMACSGFIYAMWTAEKLLQAHSATNEMKRAIVIGVERLTRVTNWTDRSTCVLFGDGAGCVFLERGRDEDTGKTGILSSFVKNYDDHDMTLTVGMDFPITPFDCWDDVLAGDQSWREKVSADKDRTMKIYMAGTQVFRFAVTAVSEVMDRALELAGIEASDIDYYVPHQANMRIISAAARRFKQPVEKFQISITNTGNVSSASIPMAFYDLMASGKVKRGEKIMLVGFGGGLSAGAVIFQI